MVVSSAPVLIMLHSRVTESSRHATPRRRAHSTDESNRSPADHRDRLPGFFRTALPRVGDGVIPDGLIDFCGHLAANQFDCQTRAADS